MGKNIAVLFCESICRVLREYSTEKAVNQAGLPNNVFKNLHSMYGKSDEKVAEVPREITVRISRSILCKQMASHLKRLMLKATIWKNPLAMCAFYGFGRE
jgi:hypothetical protein